MVSLMRRMGRNLYAIWNLLTNVFTAGDINQIGADAKQGKKPEQGSTLVQSSMEAVMSEDSLAGQKIPAIDLLFLCRDIAANLHEHAKTKDPSALDAQQQSPFGPAHKAIQKNPGGLSRSDAQRLLFDLHQCLVGFGVLHSNAGKECFRQLHSFAKDFKCQLPTVTLR